MIAIPIFLVIYMYIRPTKLLKDGFSNTKYNSEKRFCRRYTDYKWGKSAEFEKTIVADNDNKDEVKDFKKKNKQLRREKLHQK